MSDLEVAEVTFINIPGYAAHLEELGRIGPDGQWIPNGAVEHLAKEIERLRAELELEKQCYKDVQIECDSWFKAHEEEQIEHDKTRAERDALKKDAERYRWLMNGLQKEFEICIWNGDIWHPFYSEGLEKEIDKAMEESK